LRSDHGANFTLGCWRMLVVCLYDRGEQILVVDLSNITEEGVQILESQLTDPRVSILVSNCVESHGSACIVNNLFVTLSIALILDALQEVLKVLKTIIVKLDDIAGGLLDVCQHFWISYLHRG